MEEHHKREIETFLLPGICHTSTLHLLSVKLGLTPKPIFRGLSGDPSNPFILAAPNTEQRQPAIPEDRNPNLVNHGGLDQSIANRGI